MSTFSPEGFVKLGGPKGKDESVLFAPPRQCRVYWTQCMRNSGEIGKSNVLASD
jgi:hypothetical protein